jgi:hypothetical protein
MIKKLSFFIFIIGIAAVQIYPQTQEQIKRRLEQEGIKSEADIQKALKDKNMTEDDARTLAKQYGVNYDQFIQMYIMGGREILLPQTSTQLPPIETTIYEHEVVKAESETDDSTMITHLKEKKALEYFGYSLFEKIPTAFEPSAVGP